MKRYWVFLLILLLLFTASAFAERTIYADQSGITVYEENGKVLLIGVGHDRNTYLHAVDERLGIPDRLNPDPFVITIRDYDGNVLQSPSFHTHFTKASDTCVSEYYGNYREAFEYTGAVEYAKLGNAVVSVCDARRMTDTVRMLWRNTDHDLCIRKETIPREYYAG